LTTLYGYNKWQIGQQKCTVSEKNNPKKKVVTLTTYNTLQ